MAENNGLYSIQGSTLTDIADAIREKNGSTQQYAPSEMATAVLSIKGGGIEELPDNLAYLDQTIADKEFIGYGSSVTVDKTGAEMGEINPILQALYPIGSIYMSVTYFDPATVFGGVWERIQDTFLLAAGNSYAAGETGGEATHQHELSEAGWAQINAFTTADKIGMHVKQLEETYPCNRAAEVTEGGTDVDYSTRWGVILDGHTDATNGMPPYLAVYVWKRTA